MRAPVQHVRHVSRPSTKPRPGPGGHLRRAVVVRGAGPSLLVLLAASACGVHNRPQLRWIGQLTPTADAAHCPSSRGVLLLREGKVSFAPDEGTWVLEGTAGPDTLQATRTRFTPDHKTYET